jgi:hypothetical protein
MGHRNSKESIIIGVDILYNKYHPRTNIDFGIADKGVVDSFIHFRLVSNRGQNPE